MEELEEELKKQGRYPAEEMRKLEEGFFATQRHRIVSLYYFDLRFFIDTLEKFEKTPRVRGWKLSAVADFDLRLYLEKLWKLIAHRYFVIMVMENSNSGYKVIETSSGTILNFSRSDIKEGEPTENIPSELYSLINYYREQAEKIEKFFYQKGHLYKTFWLDKNYCQQLNKMLKETIDKELEKLDDPPEKISEDVDKDTGKVIERIEYNLPRGQMAEEEVKGWKLVAEKTVESFVNDLEEVRKEVYADLRGYNYWVDILMSKALPLLTFFVIAMQTTIPRESEFWIFFWQGFGGIGILMLIYFNRDFFWRKFKKN